MALFELKSLAWTFLLNIDAFWQVAHRSIFPSWISDASATNMGFVARMSAPLNSAFSASARAMRGAISGTDVPHVAISREERDLAYAGCEVPVTATITSQPGGLQVNLRPDKVG